MTGPNTVRRLSVMAFALALALGALVLLETNRIGATHAPSFGSVSVDFETGDNLFVPAGPSHTNGAVDETAGVAPGGQVTLDVVVSGASDIVGFGMEVGFDSRVLSFDQGSFLAGDTTLSGEAAVNAQHFLLTGGSISSGGLRDQVLKISRLRPVDTAAPPDSENQTLIVSATKRTGAGADGDGALFRLTFTANSAITSPTVTTVSVRGVGSDQATADFIFGEEPDGTPVNIPSVDSSGATLVTNGTVTVAPAADTTPPVVTAPGAITVVEDSATTGASGAAAVFAGRAKNGQTISQFLVAGTATDDSGSTGPVTTQIRRTDSSGNPSGSPISLPLTITGDSEVFHVTFSSTDGAGNTGSATSAITVLAFGADADLDLFVNGIEAALGTDHGAACALGAPDPDDSFPADFDGDREVGFEDFFQFADAFFGTFSARFDLDASGAIDFEDFFVFADFFEPSVLCGS